MRKKYYYVKYEGFRGCLVQAKCERSALFSIGIDRLFDNAKLKRIAEIDEKTYLRLENLRKIRKQKEQSGKKGQTLSTLSTIKTLADIIGSKGYYH